jgi:hypothetical protein
VFDVVRVRVQGRAVSVGCDYWEPVNLEPGGLDSSLVVVVLEIGWVESLVKQSHSVYNGLAYRKGLVVGEGFREA